MVDHFHKLPVTHNHTPLTRAFRSYLRRREGATFSLLVLYWCGGAAEVPDM